MRCFRKRHSTSNEPKTRYSKVHYSALVSQPALKFCVKKSDKATPPPAVVFGDDQGTDVAVYGEAAMLIVTLASGPSG